MHDLPFEQLKDEYSKRNLGCGKGYYGKIYVPQRTETHKIISPVSKEKRIVFDKPTPIKIVYPKKETISVISYTEKQFPKYTIEENVTINEQILNLLCNNWACAYCRKILKNKLYDNCLREVNRHNILYHLIATFPGGKIRKINYSQSYPILAKEYKKLIQSVNYAIYKLKKGKELRAKNTFLKDGNILPEEDFAYIKFVRSQNNPKENNPIGFCHYHTGLNLPLNVKWINETIEKNKLKIGYTFITKNSQFIDYLMGDFLTDEEYIIPRNVKHFSTSENIKINATQGFNKIENSVVFKGKWSDKEIENYLLNQYNIKYEIFGQTFETKNSVTLPYEEYFKKDRYKLIENKDSNTISL